MRRFSLVLLAALALVACNKAPAATPAAAPGAAPLAATPAGLGSPGTPATAVAPAPASAVFVNRAPLPPETLNALAAAYKGKIEPGRYWYDPASGLWGMEGGPYMGQIAPGLSLGGPLPANISTGGTGTFINGREIHPLERQALVRAYGTVSLGRFWLIADGTFGQEGGPALGNLAASSKQGGKANGGGAWSSYSPFAGTVGGDGSGRTYFSGGGTSWSNC